MTSAYSIGCAVENRTSPLAAAFSRPSSTAHFRKASATPFTAIDLGQRQFDRVRFFSIVFSISSRLGIGRPVTGHRWMVVLVDEVLAWEPSGDLREGRSCGLSLVPREMTTGGLAVGIAESLPLSVGEVVGAPFRDVRPRFWVPLAHFRSFAIDTTAVVAHRLPYLTDFSFAFWPGVRFWVKNSLT